MNRAWHNGNMGLVDIMSFVNASVVITSFALLLIVLSFSVSQINSVGVFANAKALASGIGSRLITSPNCFAYENTINYYNNNLNQSGGPLYSESDVQPGVIDVTKFTSSSFLSCVQYIYFGSATDVPLLENRLPAVAGVSLTLTDTQNPSNLGGTGSLSFSNYNQFTFGGRFYTFENAVSTYARYAEYGALAASVAASIILRSLSVGSISLNAIVALGSNSQNSILAQYSIASLFYDENTYTETFPVMIAFPGPAGQPLYENSGVLSVKIIYGVPPYD